MLTTFGCASMKPSADIKTGEEIYLHYTCRAESGRLLDTTDKKIAGDDTVEKILGFPKKARFDPILLTAGKDHPLQPEGPLKLYRPEIYSRLAHDMVGRERNHPYELIISSDVPKDIKDFSRYFTTRRIYKASDIRKEPLAYVKNVTGRVPTVGEVFDYQGEPNTKVVAVDDKTVTYQMIFDQMVIDTDYGKALVVNKDGKVITTIDAKVGTLVLTNGVMGRIVKVTDDKIKIDYGYPLGDKQLNCSVTATSPPPESIKTKTAAKAEIKK